jgi:hypothetical protein
MIDGKALSFPLKKIEPKEVAELLEVAYKPLDGGSYGMDAIMEAMDSMEEGFAYAKFSHTFKRVWFGVPSRGMVPICDDAEVLGYVTESAMMKPGKLIGVTVSDKKGKGGRVVGFKVSRRHGFILAIEEN